VSDSELVARALAARVRYRNTFLHRAPVLDICDPQPADRSSCDVLVCSDVLEHVAPPVEKAFAGMRKIVRPGGFVVLTVPCSAGERTVEHYPRLYDYRIVERDGRRVLVNRTSDGKLEEYRDLVFHGGPGETLEMRAFAMGDLERRLAEAGFGTVEIFAQPDFPHGVYWEHPYSVPIVATAAGR
ncbi:MAG TPA: class I SAM-dependent methyltransferase, partial [Usitatibacter sp.]|nr:class I SAM-dependent methyltransferase [Usitatibacter sp.]